MPRLDLAPLSASTNLETLAATEAVEDAVNLTIPSNGQIDVAYGNPAAPMTVPAGVRGVFVGAEGNLIYTDQADVSHTIISAASQYHPIRPKTISNTSTASSIILLF